LASTQNFFVGLWVAILAVGLTVAALVNYPGSKLVYLLFSVVFWLLLLSGLGKRVPYGYLFLVIALWLGFWTKTTAHLILQYPYVEPIGRFDGSAAAWDNVLWVAIVACAGAMIGKLLFDLMRIKHSRIGSINHAIVPPWYVRNRKQVWLLTLVWVVGVAVLNMVLGIHQIGLVSRTVLLWPLNALIGWQVSIGSALLITTLLWWEVSAKKSIAVSIYAVLIEAAASTVSMLSRGVYIFHALPQLFALFESRRLILGMSRLKVAMLFLVLVGLMITAISGVTIFRNYMYPHMGFTTEEQQRLTRLEVLEGGIADVKVINAQGGGQERHLEELLSEKAKLEALLSRNQISVQSSGPATRATNKNTATTSTPISDGLSVAKGKLYGEFWYEMSAGALPKVLSLVVDRWIGLEGVMAVASYPEKGYALLMEAAAEKRQVGKSTKFQEICNSHYRWVDANKWQFASLPGAVAFLYFSDSLWVVLLGMVLFTFMLQLGEQLVFVMTSNPLLCSLLGFTLANSIAQFGITPRQDIPFYSMIVCFLMLVYVVQSGVGHRLVQRVKSYCSGGA